MRRDGSQLMFVDVGGGEGVEEKGFGVEVDEGFGGGVESDVFGEDVVVEEGVIELIREEEAFAIVEDSDGERLINR